MADDGTGGVVLETERLILRRLTLEDLDVLAGLYADPEIRRFFPEGVLDRAETREELEWIIDVDYVRYGYGLWATVERSSGEVIGRCGLLPFKVVAARAPGNLALDGPDAHPRPVDRYEVEVAYLVARHRWGEGFAKEAARAIVDHAFAHLGLDRVICLVDPGNGASAAVARACGLTLAGDVEIDDEVIPLHALTRHRWTRLRDGSDP